MTDRRAGLTSRLISPEIQVLRQLAPGLLPRTIVVALLSFVSGLAEAGMLVALTGAAGVATQDGEALKLHGFELTIGSLVVIGLILLVVRVVFAVGASWLGVALSSQTLSHLRLRLVRSFLGMSPADISGERMGVLQDRLTVWCEKIAISTESVTSLFSALLNLLSFIVVAAVVDVRAVGLLVVSGGGVLFALRPIVKKVRSSSESFRSDSHSYAGVVSETTMLAPDLVLFGVAEPYQDQLAEKSRLTTASWRKARLSTMILPHTYQTLTLGVLFGALALLSGTSSSSFASWGAVVLLLVRSLSAGQQLVTYRGQLVAATPFVVEMEREFAELDRRQNLPGSIAITEAHQIRVEDVDVEFAGHRALSGVNLTLEQGESLALIGPSGAGKTTLARVILRQLQPTAGRVLVDGVALADITPDSWSARVALVRQDPVMMSGTIRDNIAFLRDVDDDAIEAACRAANVWDEINELRGGLHAEVGQARGALSGGQRQRLAIARALVERPDILVLDEPTSALDVDSEDKISTMLQGLAGQVTTIIIAHRFSTVAHCEKVLVMVDGRVDGFGRPDELEATSDFYRRMSAGESADARDQPASDEVTPKLSKGRSRR